MPGCEIAGAPTIPIYLLKAADSVTLVHNFAVRRPEQRGVGGAARAEARSGRPPGMLYYQAHD